MVPVAAAASALGALDLFKGGVSLANGLLGSLSQKSANNTNLEIARMNNEAMIQLARENNAFAKQHAIDMFNMENAYNTPLEQVKRFREAGLNPAVMMETAGGTASGNSSGAGGLSPSMPSLVTPHVEAVPPISSGFLDALNAFASIKLSSAQASKAGAETSRIETLLDQELMNLMADQKYKEAQTLYQNTIQQLEQLYGSDQRAADIAKSISEVYRNKMAGNDSAAAVALKKAEKELTESKNKQLIEQAPVILDNLRKSGELIDEQKATEKAKQASGYASAEESRAGAGLKRAQAKLLEDQHDALVRIEKSRASMSEQQYREQILTEVDRLEKIYNEGLISKAQYEAVREAAEKARKENTMYYWNEAFDKLERVNRGVNAWFSFTNY